MKKENEKPEGWVDVHDDNAVREAGLFRPYDVTPRDPSVWTKTRQERKMLRKMKHKTRDGHFHNVPRKFIKVRDTLIVQLKKNKKFPKTTYSFECWQSDISSFLAKFVINSQKRTESLIANYKWNGRTYNASELPV